MGKARKDAARQVAGDLFNSEDAIDEAAGQVAKMIQTMLAARRTGGLSAIVGQTALASSSGSLAALVEARGRIVAAHVELKDLATQLGLGDDDFGSMGGKIGAERTGLRAVA